MSTTYSCDLNTLMQLSTCYGDKCMGRVDRNAVIIWARIKNLAALGGTDYSNNVAQLMIDARQWVVRAHDELEQIATYLAVQNAINDGASLSGTPNSIITAAKCATIDCMGRTQQEGIMSFLGCAITTQVKPD